MKTKNTSPMRVFIPIRPLLVLSECGVLHLDPNEITPSRVGLKAFGLAAVSLAWSIPFFVIDSALVESETFESIVDDHIATCLESIGAESDAQLFIRSSGTQETLPERGRLHSAQSSVYEVKNTLRRLRDLNVQSKERGVIHWVVQAYKEARATGHLSNERRARREKRDWLLEVQPREGLSGYSGSIAVRPWRDSSLLVEAAMSCSTEVGVSIALKPAATWGAQFSHRMLFEWVWDGAAVRIVQADIAVVRGGVAPTKLLPKTLGTGLLGELRAFRRVCPNDFKLLRKLKNARLYQDLGYTMPDFFILDKPDEIGRIVQGDISPSVRADLRALTTRPLMIRIDGSDLPRDAEEMLPRSDALHSAAEAVAWFRGAFRKSLEKAGITNSNVKLIAHHFIPSVASAWSRAEPAKRIVRVESLWGIPEGLYYHSHDTFEVDTNSGEIPGQPLLSKLSYKYVRRLRFKETFIAPDDNGTFNSYKPMPPYDWGSSVQDPKWLFEIALRTRQIAEAEGYPVSVMWFLGNHPKASPHSVLPWFHSRSDLGDVVKASPRRKRSSSRDVRIRNQRDWEDLQERIARRQHIERVVVEPYEPSMIRDPEFAKGLGRLAHDNGFVVELKGGILSHVYHILQRAGARVECVDLFGADDEIVEFNKVVRDKISDIIVQRGERAETVILQGDALVEALKHKLVEESLESLDALSGEDLLGELADVLEVINAICRTLNVPFSRIEEERTRKRGRRGGFDRGLMLVATVTPHSIPPLRLDEKGIKPPLISKSDQNKAISDPRDLPSRQIYRKPDLRYPKDQQWEKMLTIEADVSQVDGINEELVFSFEDAHGIADKLAMVLEMRRTRGALRAIVRVRRVVTQLKLALADRQLALF